MKKILLIGGNGFVGKHLKNALIDSYEVISTGKELNINNLHDLEKFIGKIKPDAVVHLAAISSIIDICHILGNIFVLLSLPSIQILMWGYARLLFEASYISIYNK